MKGWQYTGDMDLKQGGTFWRVLEGMDCAEAVEVVPHSTVGGPDGMWWVFKGTIHIPRDDDARAAALETCGYELHHVNGTAQIWDGTGEYHGLHTPEGMTMLVDACNGYHGIDRDRPDHVVQIGKLTEFDRTPIATADKVLRSNARLDTYVRKHWLT